jgi:hypothetical protein
MLALFWISRLAVDVSWAIFGGVYDTLAVFELERSIVEVTPYCSD